MWCVSFRIFFRNLKTNKIYEPRFEQIDDPEGHSLSAKLMFDLYGMKPGKYYIDYVYKKKMIKSNFVLNVEQCKPMDYSKYYDN